MTTESNWRDNPNLTTADRSRMLAIENSRKGWDALLDTAAAPTATTAATAALATTRSQRHPDSTEAHYPAGSLARRLDAAAVAGALGHLGAVTNLWRTFEGGSGFNTHAYETTTWHYVVFNDGTVALHSTGIDCSELAQYGRCRTPQQHGNGVLHLHNSQVDGDGTVYATRTRRGFKVRRDGTTYLYSAKAALAYLNTHPTTCPMCWGTGTYTEGNDDGSQTDTYACRSCNGTGTRS